MESEKNLDVQYIEIANLSFFGVQNPKGGVHRSDKLGLYDVNIVGGLLET